MKTSYSCNVFSKPLFKGNKPDSGFLLEAIANIHFTPHLYPSPARVDGKSPLERG